MRLASNLAKSAHMTHKTFSHNISIWVSKYADFESVEKVGKKVTEEKLKGLEFMPGVHTERLKTTKFVHFR
jgi:hypothetical protein